MRYSLLVSAHFACLASSLLAADLPKPLVTGMSNPESVCVGADGAIYVTEIGEFGKAGDGQVSVIKDGKAVPLVKGLDDPKGIVASPDALYVTDVTKVLKIDNQGKATVFAAADQFPTEPLFLNDVAIDLEKNILFVSDSGDLKGSGGAVYRIDLATNVIDTIVSEKNLPDLKTPNGVAMDGTSHLLVLDFGSGALYRVQLADKSHERIGAGFDGGDGLVWDKHGQLFVTSWKTGKVFGIPRPGQKAIELPIQFEQAADSCLDGTGRNLLVPDMKAGTLTAIPTSIPGWEVDMKPLAIQTEIAFPKLEWTGWQSEDDSGKPAEFRPILLTYAADGTNRLFVPSQQGVIHSFKNTDDAQKSTIFLDISDRVRYTDKQNEEGLLGLAFHPKFKQNGEFFVFYTDVKAEMENVVSRFRVSKSDPTKADPKSEEELLRFKRPFWNHDGGTIAFGPDGYLYVVHGDGGAGGDPYGNGQKLSNWLGKILRIDVDRKAKGKNYTVPNDNPFVETKGALPEIWAYGLRNPWRIAFDRKTGQLWAGEVGQNLFEEIILIKAGGNYGWSLRESFHPFSARGVDVRADLIEPIWEYNHDIGKSITGGLVYRGKKLPELEGAYLYADYVSAKIWALWYDAKKGRVVANREIKGAGLPILSFGEDADGEPYVLSASPTGNGIYRFVKEKK